MPMCPAGHASTATDYCDICGAPMPGEVLNLPDAAPAGPAPVPPSSRPAREALICPSCGATNSPDALFCEACGYDYTTGTPPRGAQPPVAQASPHEQAATEVPSPEPASPELPQAAGDDEGITAPEGNPAPEAPPASEELAADPVADAGHALPGLSGGVAASAPGPETAGSLDVPVAEAPASPDVPVTETPAPAASPAGPAPAPAPVAPPAEAPPAPGAPSPSPGKPVEWVAEIWIDPDWYATQGSSDPLPSPGLPDVVPLRRTSVLVGRVSISRNIHPDIDCELDSGVSRRHAQLSTDGTRWWIEDLDSANGTFVAPASGPLPSMPIPRGRVEVAADQRIYVGAWTRIVIRRATEDEQQAFA